MEPQELRDWIDRHGYTVSAFARELGVSRETVHRWLRGATPIPRMVDLALVALEGDAS